jgi:trimethylamine--corrinoid protein Co-methyltransferase
MEVLRHAILNGPGETETILSQDTPMIWCNPISPLQYHSETVTEIIAAIKKWGSRCYIKFSSAIMLGSTGPVTMAASLAQHNAEVMAGVVLTQLIAAGTPVIYGSVSGVMDLRTTEFSLGSMESIMFCGCVVQLADYYGIPNRIHAGVSSAREPGVRAAVEAAWGLQMGLSSGGNLITTGLLDSTLMLSLEHIVLMDELVNQISSASAAGIVDAAHLARDVILEEGRPSTRYMSHEHTLEHMKEAMYYSEFTGRMEESYRDWYELAHQKTRQILSSSGEDTAGDKSLLQKYEAVGARFREDDNSWREGKEGWWQFYVKDLG